MILDHSSGMDFRAAVIYFSICILAGASCGLAVIGLSFFGIPERSKNRFGRIVRKAS